MDFAAFIQCNSLTEVDIVEVASNFEVKFEGYEVIILNEIEIFAAALKNFFCPLPEWYKSYASLDYT
mgnify:CR=1 FL=1